MSKIGKVFKTHLYTRWGERKPIGKRQTDSRDVILEEAYIHIPQDVARTLGIYMSNQPKANTKYEAFDEHGRFIATLKAQGNSAGGNVHAKQFSGSGNLKALAPWVKDCGIADGDILEVEFISENSMRITKK